MLDTAIHNSTNNNLAENMLQYAKDELYTSTFTIYGVAQKKEHLNHVYQDHTLEKMLSAVEQYTK